MREIDPNLPVNKLAALQICKNSEAKVSVGYGHKITSMIPLPTTQFHGKKEHDLSGKRVGDFTVIGFALWKPANWRTSTNSARWVAKCKCGRYQQFTTKGIKKNINNPMFACVDCQKTKRLSGKSISSIEQETK
jgi:hypothetical protein